MRMCTVGCVRSNSPPQNPRQTPYDPICRAHLDMHHLADQTVAGRSSLLEITHAALISNEIPNVPVPSERPYRALPRFEEHLLPLP